MKREGGQAFILVLILLAVGSLLIIPFLQATSTVSKSRLIYGEFIKEDFAADAAVEYGMWRLQYEAGFAESLPIGTESPPFYVTLNGITANATVLAQALELQLSGQDLGGRAEGEVFFKVEKSVVATSTFATIAADGFESGGGTGGTGTWSTNWTFSGDYQVTTYNEYEGDYCLMLRGDGDAYPGNGYAQRKVNLSGATGLGPYLKFWGSLENMESGNTVQVRASTNGVDWDILETLDGNNPYQQYPYDLSSYGKPSTFYVSLKMNGDHSSDTFYLDDLRFTTTEEATVVEPGVDTIFTYYVSLQCIDPDG